MNAVIRETIITRVNNEPVIKDDNEITDDNIPVITDNSDKHIQATDNIHVVSDASNIPLITNNFLFEEVDKNLPKQGDMTNILVIKDNHEIYIEEPTNNIAIINDISKLHIATTTDNQIKTGKYILEAKPKDPVITDNSKHNMQSTPSDNISINILPASSHEMTKQVNQMNDKLILHLPLMS